MSQARFLKIHRLDNGLLIFFIAMIFMFNFTVKKVNHFNNT